MKVVLLVLSIIVCFGAHSNESMDGMYYCQELALVSVKDGTSTINEYKGRKFTLKVKDDTARLDGGDNFSSFVINHNLITNFSTGWIYGSVHINENRRAIFHEFRLKDGKFVLLNTAGSDEYLLSTGTCTKW